MGKNPYSQFLRPLLFQLDSEQAHQLAHRSGRLATGLWPLLRSNFVYAGDDLQADPAGIKLHNPVGLAAGFDKNGHLTSILGHLGFGFAEIGSVTAMSCAGNPKPRLFRLPEDEALINRMGLNGDGADIIAARLAEEKFSLPVAVNIAKTNDPNVKGDAAVEDILYTFNKVKSLPISYVTINASCPNTHEGIVEEAQFLETLFAQISKANLVKIPVFVKLSPDSSDELISDIVGAAATYGLSGYLCGNTTISRNNLHTASNTVSQIGNGGLSGKPLRQLALNLCRKIYGRKHKDQSIIGCGGISSGQDAFDFICAGASAIQIYTGLIYEGPTLPLQINKELSAILKHQGITLKEAIGVKA